MKAPNAITKLIGMTSDSYVKKSSLPSAVRLAVKSMIINGEVSSYCARSSEVLNQHDVRILPVRLRA